MQQKAVSKMPSFLDMKKYAATGIASPSMTYFDRMRANAIMGGGKTRTLTAQPPLSFKADGEPLISWSMKGNGSQTGTPTPNAPITPDFVGTLSGSDWIIPISCAGQTTPVYLGQTPTVRRVKKFVLTGAENWTVWNYLTAVMFYTPVTDGTGNQVFSSHFGTRKSGSFPIVGNLVYNGDSNKNMIFRMSDDTTITTVDGFKEWLAAQHANGTPVIVWYILANEGTAIINEPLAKIGDYADELSSTDAGVSIPTVKGQNTLTVDTTLQPSEMTITYLG